MSSNAFALVFILAWVVLFGYSHKLPSSTASLPRTTPAAQLVNRNDISCPEECGFPPWACDCVWCGGDNDTQTCAREGSNGCTCVLENGFDHSTLWTDCEAPPTSIVASDVTTFTLTQPDGGRVTASYSKVTDSDYTDLVGFVTLTTTIPYTMTGSTSGIVNVTKTKTLWPGGYALELIPPIWLGPGPPPPTPEIPTDGGEEEEEEERHKNKCGEQKPKCSDWDCQGGLLPLPKILKMCTFPGEKLGCPCEEDECPDKEIECTDCGGQNGICTLGDYKNCHCTSSCPEGEDTLRCDQCGGQGDNWNTCAGTTDDVKKDLYKGCGCSPYDSPDPYPAPSGPEEESLDYIFSHLLDWNDDWDLLPVPPECQGSSFFAPQRGSDRADINVDKAIQEFCNNVNGTQLAKPTGADRFIWGLDILYDLYPLNLTEAFWLSANYRTEAPDYLHCPQNVTVTEHECIRILTYAMITCDPNSGGTHGAAYEAGCIHYNVTIDQDDYQDWSSPPWKRLGVDALYGVCDYENPSMVYSTFWNHIYPNFCDAMDGKTNKAIERVYKSADYRETGDADSGMYPPQDGNPWRFNFRFEPTEGQNIPCHFSCSEAFDRISKGHCGKLGTESNKMANESSIWAGCGTYYNFIEPPAPNEVLCDYERRDITRIFYDGWQARQSINMFCNGQSQSWDLPARDMIVEPNPTTRPGDANYPSRWYYYGFPTAALNISVAFADVLKANQFPGADDVYPSNSDCNSNSAQAFKVVDHKEECLNLLHALDDCQSPFSLAMLSGAAVIQHRATYGCAVWTLTTSKSFVPDCVKDRSCKVPFRVWNGTTLIDAPSNATLPPDEFT